uniref:Uncharacterized protein n=1 Tax=Rhizophora mucronata TaxID=61149 RepID=A0A2P2Q4Z5_RHIMU
MQFHSNFMVQGLCSDKDYLNTRKQLGKDITRD